MMIFQIFWDPILRVFVEIQMETLNEMVVQYLMLVLMLEKHLKVPFDTGELEDGIRELTEKILENNIAADDDITFDFSVTSATYIVTLCEKSITENSLAFKGRVRDLYFLGSNDELKSYGAVTRSHYERYIG